MDPQQSIPTVAHIPAAPPSYYDFPPAYTSSSSDCITDELPEYSPRDTTQQNCEQTEQNMSQICTVMPRQAYGLHMSRSLQEPQDNFLLHMTSYRKHYIVSLLIFSFIFFWIYSITFFKPSANYGLALSAASVAQNVFFQKVITTQAPLPKSKPRIITPVSPIKSGSRWIVVTTINTPTEDVRRLAAIAGWNLVVVADTKTPKDWKLDNVHFLSIEFQKKMVLRTVQLLPFKSYTRKNIGYLYAISHGAEWIYDTDDDNKPYGLGLNQFDYGDEVSGVRYQVRENDTLVNKLFNPYQFFGRKDMWPRGFPLEYLKEHTNGKNRTVLCSKMSRSAVQQGLVHHDPDVDAIYRLQHADPQSGLDENFNKLAPPITLSPGTFAPWNSQNTLFHKSAFHTLFLPTTVSFRTTDIWRSYYAQKILHLSGLSVSFTPVNAIQIRNAHDYLRDFKEEYEVYEDAGKILKIINSWKCSFSLITECMKELADVFVKEKIWDSHDAYLITIFVEDLERIGFEFPPVVDQNALYSDYQTQKNESSRDVNCRRTSLNFELNHSGTSKNPAIQRAEKKINYFGDVVNWCNEAGYSNLSNSMPSPTQLAKRHAFNPVLNANMRNVLIITSNYEWRWAIGLLQRLHEPFFGLVVFCGPFYPNSYNMNETNFPPIMESFNYIHLNPAEIHSGYFAYHCLTMVKEMKLSNVMGYFMVADDSHFNIWQQIDFKRAFHLHGVSHFDSAVWWDGEFGIKRAEEIVKYAKTSKDEKVRAVWKRFEDGLRLYRYIRPDQTAFDDMVVGTSRSVSDFFYVPARDINFYGDLMTIFYKFQLFHELAVNKFLRSVNHQTSKQLQNSYLWGSEREKWAELWNADFVGFHPIKLSEFINRDKKRVLYCSTVIQTWRNILFGDSKNYTMKKIDDPDYMNG